MAFFTFFQSRMVLGPDIKSFDCFFNFFLIFINPGTAFILKSLATGTGTVTGKRKGKN